jgi:hypothetical protein
LFQDALDVRVDALSIGGNDIVERHAPEFLFRVAERFPEGGIEFYDASGFSIYKEDVLRGLLHHRTVE